MESIVVKYFEIYYDSTKEEFIVVITKSDNHFQTITFDAFDDEIDQYFLDLFEDLIPQNSLFPSININNIDLIFDQELYDQFLSEYMNVCIKRDGLEEFYAEEKSTKYFFH